MNLSRTRGYGPYLAIWGLALIASVPLMDASLIVAVLGAGFIYYGIHIYRSGSLGL